MNKKQITRKSMGKFPVVPGNPDPKAGKWNELYALTGHWQSDLKFFKDELRFLNRVINKFFIWLTEDGNVMMARTMVNRLTGLEGRRNALDLEIAKYMSHIRELLQNPFPYDDTRLREQHMELESELAAFVKDFRSLKEEVFELTEQVLETEDGANQFLGS